MKVRGIPAQKINSEVGDIHPDGTSCYIIAETIEINNIQMYLVIYEDFNLPIGVMSTRIEIIEEEPQLEISLTTEQEHYLSELPDIFNKYEIENEKKEEKSL